MTSAAPARSARAPRRRRLPFTRSADPAVDEQALVRRYTRDRWSQAQCARLFGIRVAQVRAILLRHGVQLRTPNPRAPIDEQAVLRTYTRHGSISYVAKVIAADEAKIRDILDKHGVPHGSHPRPPEIGTSTPKRRPLFTRARPDAEPSPADLLLPSQAARILRIKVPELKAAARAGQINEVRTAGGHRRYVRRDVLDLARLLAPARQGQER